MRPAAAAASAPAGGSREQEQGEAQGGSEVLVSGRVRVIRRVVCGEWEDEQPLASSPLAIRCSLWTFAPFLRGETPRRRTGARRASHLEREVKLISNGGERG